MIRFVTIAMFLGFFLELGLMIAVGRRIGVMATLLAVAGSGALGVMVIRSVGLGMAVTMRQNRKFANRDAAAQFLLLPAGVLLIIPGFITDAVGLILLLPPLRRWLAGRLTGTTTVPATSRGGPVIEGEAVETTDEREH